MYKWMAQLERNEYQKPGELSVLKERQRALRNKTSEKLFLLVIWDISGSPVWLHIIIVPDILKCSELIHPETKDFIHKGSALTSS